MIETSGYIYDNGYNINVTAPSYYKESDITLEEVYLLYFDDGRLIKDLMLERGPSEVPDNAYYEPYFQLSSDEKLESTTLVIRVVFSDGKSFERQIYSSQ